MERLLTFEDFLNEAGDNAAWLNDVGDLSQPAADEFSAADAPDDLGDEIPEESEAIVSLEDEVEVEFEAVVSLVEE